MTETKKVNIELEVDTNVVNSGMNPYQNIIYLARAVDAWRIFPRLFLTVYIVLLYKVVIWFMALEAPNFEQSGLVSIVVGAGAAWFGLYTGSSKKIPDPQPQQMIVQSAPAPKAEADTDELPAPRRKR
jgi:hypothetical protein